MMNAEQERKKSKLGYVIALVVGLIIHAALFMNYGIDGVIMTPLGIAVFVVYLIAMIRLLK